jgi:guanylate kinase
MSTEERGILLVVSSPSGAGKTTLCRRLVQEHDQLNFSISYTTRSPRSTEQDGVDYHFVDEARFEELVVAGQFAEWAHVHDHRYGTARDTVEQTLSRGEDLVFDIDWQGGLQLRDRYPEETVLVFVLPPSMMVLAQRLRGRGTDAAEVVARRLSRATEELRQHTAYHYLLPNDDLERAYASFRAIYHAAHFSGPRKAYLAEALLSEETARS